MPRIDILEKNEMKKKLIKFYGNDNGENGYFWKA